MSGLFLLLGLALAGLWAAAVARTAWMLSHPPRRTYGSAVARGRPGDPSELPGPARAWSEWSVTSRGLTLPVWEIAGDRADGPTVVLTHGWGDSRIGGLSRVAALAPVASRLILWDLPGHGEAPGVCRLGTAEAGDLLALLEQLGPGEVVLYGWSMGAGVSIAAARFRVERAAAVVAESPYRLAPTPARNVLRARGLPYRLILGPAIRILFLVLPSRPVEPRGHGDLNLPFDRATLAAGVAKPLLVLHGEHDEICPVQDGREIAAAATLGRLVVVEGGGHNDLWTDPRLAARCTEEVRGFIGGIESGAGAT